VRAGQPVFCLRTFSKAYGIAGLRIGYLVGPPEHVAEMNKVREPFNTNHLAQVAAVTALADERHLRRVVRLNRRERERLGTGLAALGLDVIPSEANFLLVGTRRDGNALYQELLRRGVIVRPVGNYGYPLHLRITVGLPEQNDRLLAALHEALAVVPTS
jgi:histidinol-phosphate aminotransferase